MSQVEWSKLCDVTKTTQSNYENEIRSPDAKYLAKAAQLGVDVQYVITGERCEKQQNLEQLQELEKMVEQLLGKVRDMQKG